MAPNLFRRKRALSNPPTPALPTSASPAPPRAPSPPAPPADAFDGRADRPEPPKSYAELADIAEDLVATTWDASWPIAMWFKALAHLGIEGDVYEHEGNYEMAFIRTATVLKIQRDVLPYHHPEWESLPAWHKANLAEQSASFAATYSKLKSFFQARSAEYYASLPPSSASGAVPALTLRNTVTAAAASYTDSSYPHPSSSGSPAPSSSTASSLPPGRQERRSAPGGGGLPTPAAVAAPPRQNRLRKALGMGHRRDKSGGSSSSISGRLPEPGAAEREGEEREWERIGRREAEEARRRDGHGEGEGRGPAYPAHLAPHAYPPRGYAHRPRAGGGDVLPLPGESDEEEDEEEEGGGIAYSPSGESAGFQRTPSWSNLGSSAAGPAYPAHLQPAPPPQLHYPPQQKGRQAIPPNSVYGAQHLQPYPPSTLPPTSLPTSPPYAYSPQPSPLAIVYPHQPPYPVPSAPPTPATAAPAAYPPPPSSAPQPPLPYPSPHGTSQPHAQIQQLSYHPPSSQPLSQPPPVPPLPAPVLPKPPLPPSLPLPPTASFAHPPPSAPPASPPSPAPAVLPQLAPVPPFSSALQSAGVSAGARSGTSPLARSPSMSLASVPLGLLRSGSTSSVTSSKVRAAQRGGGGRAGGLESVTEVGDALPATGEEERQRREEIPPVPVSWEVEEDFATLLTPRPVPSRLTARTESGAPLRPLVLPSTLPGFFMHRVAASNTARGRETCGLLLGRLSHNILSVTHLLVPKQTGTSDMCETTHEEEQLAFQTREGLLTLGWIHTHPTQSVFLSSRDLHTHAGYQLMLPEAIAVVCSPRFEPSVGVFRMTDPPGLQTVMRCTASGTFHEHPDVPIYTDVDQSWGHCKVREEATFECVDLR
ncbi:hypothetical protein JCM8097_003948 [Rhodosporidiobolus ruineniae]